MNSNIPISQQQLIVQKYGGSSLSTPEQVKSIAKQIQTLHGQGNRLIIVVSAMGKTTDQLISLAYQVSPKPNRRELDMLLTTGERMSMALMSMALNDLNINAISFTGSQAGILTDEQYSNARIIDIKSVRVQNEIEKNNIVVLAGFQGVSPVTKEITTLGRGGTDVTAVAMAAQFKAQQCEIRKDVDGVYSADPNLVHSNLVDSNQVDTKNSRPRHIAHLSFDQLLDLTFWGAKVLHYRSVELAKVMNVPLVVCLSHPASEIQNKNLDSSEKSNLALANSNQEKLNLSTPNDERGQAQQNGRATRIDHKGSDMFEQVKILSVNSHQDVRNIEVQAMTLADALKVLRESLALHSLPLPQLLDSEKSAKGWSLLVTAPSENINSLVTALTATATSSRFQVATHSFSTVTVTCQGSYSSSASEQIAQQLTANSIPVLKLIFSAMSVTAVVDAQDRDRAVNLLHALQLV
jgi:aspartate kinase